MNVGLFVTTALIMLISGCRIRDDNGLNIAHNNMEDVVRSSIENGNIEKKNVKLLSSDEAPFDYFGKSVSISSDGNTV